MKTDVALSNSERVVTVANGWVALTLLLLLLLADIGLFIYSIAAGVASRGKPLVPLLVASTVVPALFFNCTVKPWRPHCHADVPKRQPEWAWSHSEWSWPSQTQMSRSWLQAEWSRVSTLQTPAAWLQPEWSWPSRLHQPRAWRQPV